MSRDPRQRLRENPFLVLGVAVDAEGAVVERAAQRLLAELAIGRAAAATYETPFGPVPRTSDLVRAAAAELRDPARRLGHELRAEAAQGAAVAVPEAGVTWAQLAPFLGLRSGGL